MDEDALAEALTTRQIFGAAVDVLRHEPADLKVNPKLISQPNFLCTAHVGGTTTEIIRASTIKAVEDVHAFFEGRTDTTHRVI